MRVDRTSEGEVRRFVPLAARHVAVREGEGWRVERHGPDSGRDRLVTAWEVVASLPQQHGAAADMARSFLAVGGPTVVFEVRDGAVRQAVAAKVVPYRVKPILALQPLTPGTAPADLDEAHPLLSRALALSGTGYGWDHPAYREACAAMGLDPDHGRPRYRAPYAALAAELEGWAAHAFGSGVSAVSPAGEANAVAFDLLDLMRADRLPDPALLDRVRERIVRADPGLMPRFPEMERLANSEDLLADGVRYAEAPCAAVDFLPSRWGSGYSASIYGCTSTREPDGWPEDRYADLCGLAVEPDAEDLWRSAWLRTAVRRLREGGVHLLGPREAARYLAGDEAAYWVCWHGGTMRWRDAVREPTDAERARWRTTPPDLPLDRLVRGAGPERRRA
ncbi:hypothetical protein LPC08_25275 (plasmid) [Roseomonas sp. OT10]|uniref:hypothetical protein n=1 Tax=Roseomonas cutis TaxID=2897332 RepID=UPI001E387B76|nr:hypothetical protein [Roseomonas sp. OT10]UFN51578.1 hypothetical protein LPC08_25275 [Roseomonas sp. OT10]